MIKRILAAVLSLLLILQLTPAKKIQHVIAAETTIHIKTEDDLKELAKNCRLDSYSRDLIVLLDNDIDLGGKPFSPIPIFSGVFNGQNHTIKGFSCANDGSNQGFFRYIQANAIVMNLNLEGEVTPEVGQCNIGGMVGTNYGEINSCTFTGTVEALINTGGIAGMNEGKIITCGAKGKISGKQYTGGIVGFNSGSVSGCTNEAEVNTEIKTGSIDIAALSLLELVDLNTISVQNSDTVIDTGGITGGSTGIVKDCTNRGTIGYQHFGYNVGGISGRQQGYLTGCENYGEVYGRKDVAGICGQMEPYLYLMDSENLVEELSELNKSISIAMEDLGNDADNMSGQLADLKQQTDGATVDAQKYSHSVDNLYDKASEAAEAATSRKSGAFASVVAGGASDVADIIGGLDQSEKDELLNGSLSQDTVDKIKESISGGEAGSKAESIGSAIGVSSGAAESAADRVSSLVDKNNDESSKAEATIESAGAQVSSAVDNIGKETSGSGESKETESKTESSEAETSSQKPAESVADRVSSEASNIDVSKETNPYESVKESVVSDIKDGNINQSDISSAQSAAKDNAAAELVSSRAAALESKKASQSASESASKEAMEEQRTQAMIKAQNAVADKVQSIGTALSNLNDNLAGITGNFADNMQMVNEQFTKVNELMTKILTGDMTYYEDISKFDTETDYDGKVSNCTNYGPVNGDENIGGIAGEMAIEIEFDTESDIIGSGLAVSGIVSKMYETRAVIRSCSNQAPVEARKSYTGGIVGNNTLGIVSYCENYGDIHSDSEYVGGIAGNSDSWVMGSYSLCNLSGKSYVGGITGYGTQVTDSFSIVSFDNEHNACSGAIAGYIDVTNSNSAVKNYFVSDTLGGIDGISYEGMAEPISYEAMVKSDSIPEEFRHMVVSFVADGVTVKLCKVQYGQSLDETEIPSVPVKEGYTGEWEKADLSAIKNAVTIEAVYYAKMTSMVSEEKRSESDLPVVLVEGDFEGNATVTLDQVTDNTPALSEADLSEVLDIRINSGHEKSAEESYTVRYLPAETKGNTSLYVLDKDGNMTPLETEIKGSYLVFKTASDEIRIAAFHTPDKTEQYMKIGAAAAGGILILGLILAFIKKAGKKAVKAEA